VKSVKIGMIFTCPGIARPSENSAKSTFPEIVTDLAIAYATRLAKRIVKKTENTATITEFLKGVKTLPESIRVRKLSRFQVSGNAKGLV
jgi:hypothetical protein